MQRWLHWLPTPPPQHTPACLVPTPTQIHNVHEIQPVLAAHVRSPPQRPSLPARADPAGVLLGHVLPCARGVLPVPVAGVVLCARGGNRLQDLRLQLGAAACHVAVAVRVDDRRQVLAHVLQAHLLQLLGVVLLRQRERGRHGLHIYGLAQAPLAHPAYTHAREAATMNP